MKRLLNILLLAFAWQAAYGQDQPEVKEMVPQVTNVSYIYRNDDHFNGFADGEVDSITFSRIDADGVEHPDFVTQVVHTPDSVYYIPLAVIDSVLCEQPPMELKKDVVMLTEEQRGFVVRTDSTTILFRSDTPRDLLPSRGEILLTMGTAERPEAHIAGRVVRSERTADGVLVTCDPELQMGDIFRRFTAVMFASPLEPDANENPAMGPLVGALKDKFDPFSKSAKWVPSTKTYTDPETGEKIKYSDDYISGFSKEYGPYSKNLFDFVPEDKQPAWMKSGNVGLTADVTVGLKYRQKFLIDCYYDDDDIIFPSLYFYFRPTLLPSLTTKLTLKLQGEFDKEFKLPFIPDVPAIGIWTPPAPPAIPPIRVGEVNIHLTNMHIRVGGEGEVNYTFTLQKVFDIEAEYNSSGLHVTNMATNGGYTDKSGLTNKGFGFGDSELGDEFEQIGNVYLWLAWNPSVGISLVNEHVLTAAINAKVGPWFQLNVEKTKEPSEDEYTRFWSTWSPTHLLTKLHVEPDFTITVGKGTKLEEKFSLVSLLSDFGVSDGKGFDFLERRWGIFPSFGTPTLFPGWEQSLAQRGAILFSTDYENPKINKMNGTFLSSSLGLGLYKVDGEGKQKLVAKSFSPKTEKGWFSTKTGSYTTEFANVKRGVFKVAPLFDAPFFDPIRATTETDVTIPPSAITEEVTSVGQHHCFMNGYTLGLKEFNDFFGGDVVLGWILGKVDEGGASNNLTLANSFKSGTFHEGDVVAKTVNDEDKLCFGPNYSSSSAMATMSRCDGLTPSTNYQYRTWAQYTDGFQTKVVYGEVKEFTTQPSDSEPRCEVDLGLSVNWACYNVGAAREYQNGDYYAWGEKSKKKEYKPDNYKMPNKENISGDTNYDVATTWNKGKNSGWRMPTKAEFQELIDNCDMEWVTNHKVKGIKFTSKRTGNYIFLPAAGNKYDKKVYSNGVGGCYWSADFEPESLDASDGTEEREDDDETGIGEGDAEELTKEEKANAWRLHFNNVEEEGKAAHFEAGRCFYGRSVRPVKDNPNYKPEPEPDPEQGVEM